jgi:hypothetical protein
MEEHPLGQQPGIMAASSEWAIQHIEPVGQQSMLHTATAIHDNAWVFGVTLKSAGRFGTLVFRREGHRWRRDGVPCIGRVNRALAISETDVWAVGDGDSLRWDGTRWHQFRAATFGADCQLFGLAQIGAYDIFTAGCIQEMDGSHARGTVQRWDGDRWVALPVPNTLSVPGKATGWILTGITGSSVDDIWAVGHVISGPACGLALHWDGKGWDSVPVTVPDSGSVRLNDALMLGDGQVIAAGHRTRPATVGTREPLVMKWNSKTWSEDKVGGSWGISQLVKGTSRVWAVGYAPNGGAYLSHSDGSGWRQFPAPERTDSSLALYGGAALPGNTLLVVGAATASATSTQPFAALTPWLPWQVSVAKGVTAARDYESTERFVLLGPCSH